MDSTLTWRGGNGSWSSALDWSGLRVPGAGDDVALGTSGTVSVDGGVLAEAADLTVPGDTLAVAAGATLAVGGGVLAGDGGTLDGTLVQGGLSDLGDLTITGSAASANAGGTITPDGTLGLAATLVLSQDSPSAATNAGPVYGDAVGLGGAGAMLNLGTVTSDFANAAQGELAISVASFTNAGTMDFAPMAAPQSLTMYQPAGKFGQDVAVPVVWTQDSAPTLEITSVTFDNAGMLSLEGGTLDVAAAQFDNSGAITLTDATTQAVLLGPGGIASVIDAPLTTQIEFGAGVTGFTNTGGIAADRVRFDNDVSLAGIGAVSGALDFAGTLDLGAGTLTLGAGFSLAATAAGSTVSIAGPGVVANDGSLSVDAATLLVSATLAGNGVIMLADGAVVTLDALAAGAAPDIVFGAGPALLTLPGNGAGVTLTGLKPGDLVDFASLPDLPAPARGGGR